MNPSPSVLPATSATHPHTASRRIHLCPEADPATRHPPEESTPCFVDSLDLHFEPGPPPAPWPSPLAFSALLYEVDAPFAEVSFAKSISADLPVTHAMRRADATTRLALPRQRRHNRQRRSRARAATPWTAKALLGLLTVGLAWMITELIAPTATPAAVVPAPAELPPAPTPPLPQPAHPVREQPAGPLTLRSETTRLRRSTYEETRRLRREITSLREEVDTLTLPFREDVLSATVRTVVPPDNVLVMGGYRRADGSHEFTFVTPEIASDGQNRGLIRLSAQVALIPQTAIAGLGMQTLATGVRNTLQHGETWSQADASETLRAPAVQVIGQPSIAADNHSPFELSLGHDENNRYQLQGRASIADDGRSVILESTVVRREP